MTFFSTRIILTKQSAKRSFRFRVTYRPEAENGMFSTANILKKRSGNKEESESLELSGSITRLNKLKILSTKA